MAEDTELIQKSVRLPRDMVDYIYSQSGRSFTECLISVVNDHRYGVTPKMKELKRLREDYEQMQAIFKKYSGLAYDTSRLFTRMFYVLEEAKDFVNKNYRKP